MISAVLLLSAESNVSQHHLEPNFCIYCRVGLKADHLQSL